MAAMREYMTGTLIVKLRRSRGTAAARLGHQFHVEEVGDLEPQALLHLFDIDLSTQLLRQAGDPLVSDAAGHDVVEVGEVGVHVEGEAVHGDPAAGADAEGADLPGFRRVVPVEPDAGEPID